MLPFAFLCPSQRTATTHYCLFLPRLKLRHVSGSPRQLSEPGPVSQNVCGMASISFRQRLAFSRPVTPFAERVRWKITVGRHVLFVVVVSFSSFSAAACYANVQTETWLQSTPQFKNVRRPRSVDLFNASLQSFVNRAQQWLNDMTAWLSQRSYTALYRYQLVISIQAFLEYHIRGVRHIASAISATSLLVFVVTNGWPGARRFFVHNPISGRRYTLFTSIFSFRSFTGLVVAWWTVDNFSGAFIFESWKEDGRPGSFPEVDPAYRFLAFYISAGLFAGLVSHIVAARTLYSAAISRIPLARYFPRIFRRYPAASGGKLTDIPTSGGGAGAVYACVAWEACNFPDTVWTFQDNYPDEWSLPSTAAVAMLVMWNLLGLKRGWRRFNHVANLAGSAFGAMYAYYGLRFWDWMRAVQWPGPRTKASAAPS